MDKKQHPLDDLFRQGLTNLEIKPTETGRSVFLGNADRELKKKSRKAGWLPGTVVVLGILLTGAIIVFFNTGKNPPEATKTQKPNDNAVTRPPALNTELGISRSAIETMSREQNTDKHSLHNNPASAFQTHKNDQTSFTDKEDHVPPVSAVTDSPVISATSTEESAFSEATATRENNKESVSEIVTKEPLKPIPFDSLSKNSSQSYDSVNNPGESKTKKDAGPRPTSVSHNDDWNIRVGIYGIPEWILNTLDNNKYVNNFGIETQFRFGPYSVRTGIGLSITRGYNELVIETRPYLGSYRALDHVTYQWDSKHYHLVPTYYTTLKEVFDTALHKNYFKLEKEYTYLQIPMILGYDFYTEKWFSLGARMGPVMSLLLKTRELTSGYNAGKDQINSINNVTPDRIHLNWQAMGGINASFHLSRLLIFDLEPEVRYYFNSVYEKSSPSSKPWSVGIRGALLVNF